MKYNSVENAEQFINDQFDFCKRNGIHNFIIWSNGNELAATQVSNDISNIFSRCDLQNKGFWKAIIFENGHRVEI